MGNVIQTNVASLGAQRSLARTNNELGTTFQRLSTGLRINSARDDAAGLQISNKLTSQINGLGVATRNANDGISLAQTAEGALQETTNILQRIRDLSIQASNGSLGSSERSAVQDEVSQLIQEVDRISSTTSFGSRKLLDGTFGSSSFQVGAQANETINIQVTSSAAAKIGVARVEVASATVSTGLGRVLAAAGTVGASNVAGGNFVIAGKASSTVVGVAASSARELQDVINGASGTTGVQADARTVVRLSGLSAAGNVTFTLGSDTGGSTATASISATVTSTTDLSDLADAINKEASKTGISAVINGTGATIDLISENGDDITILDFAVDAPAAGASTITVTGRDYANGAATDAITLTENTNDSTRAMGNVRLTSADAFSVTSADATINPTVPESSTLAKVSTIDVSTAIGAQDAITVVDGAIASIDNDRAKLGAVQNRLQSTISNLGNIIENVSAARSRTRDTDFAAETANLAKNQVLQQAGLSILAQANASSQSVLSLLQ
jgi:flagellin